MAAVYSDSDIVSAAGRAAEKMGYSLREVQQEIVLNFVRGWDVFVSLPTGSGKSLCYSCLPWTFDVLKDRTARSIIVVVSPLMALMKDQVTALQRKGVSAAYVCGVDDECDDRMVEELHEGQYQVIFFSPESLLTNETWRDMLQSDVYQVNTVGFIVDEAHCVKKWGETFRREFSHLGEVSSLLPEGVHIMALTATATRPSCQNICRILGMKRPYVVAQSPNKPNVYFEVCTKPATVEEAFAPCVEELRHKRNLMERTIIFGQTYNDCTHVYHFFRSRLGKEMSHPIGVLRLSQYTMVDMFTACTHPDVKNTILKQYQDPDSCLRIVIATIAFGMGLDCPNVRRIIHWGVPSDIESYLQETGRAGRDGQPACARLYYCGADFCGLRVEQSMKDYCLLKGQCRREILLQDFDQGDHVTVTACKCCDVCASRFTCSSCTE